MSKKNAAGVIESVDADDAPELTGAFFDKAEAFKGNSFIHRGRDRPPSETRKELISIRLDPEVLDRLRASGPGWQSRVNGLLRQALGLDHN
jgi:uncharacterized protein (DUF4415 family)